ncbi:branched-chain amino acid aminotransferase [bacterium A37T11]|nr:branched-chain amino acid aminotransferase [bacterium A37T11]
MAITYININGEIVVDSKPVLTTGNRGFRYGDGIFETMRWADEDIRFLDYHLERLRESMHMLHLEGSHLYSVDFLREKAAELVQKNNFKADVRLRLGIYRGGGGLYSPEINKAAYVMEASDLSATEHKSGLIVDIYAEYRKPVSSLSKLKSANSLLYVMAGLYRKQKGLDEVIILNQNGFLCESGSSNLFVWYENKLYTPAVSEGCIAGVMRRVVIELALGNDIQVIEAQINPDILQLADELFLTNAIHGIQWVMGYKKKRYFNRISKLLQEKLNNWPVKTDTPEETHQ